MRFKLSKPYLNRKTHRFERLILGVRKIRFTKTKLGRKIVTKKNADEYFYPLVFNSKNNMRHGKSVWVSEADEYWTYYKIRDVKFGKLYRRQFNIRRQK